MAKKNTAKRNFLTSLVATGVSMSMLVGTTFAWFTDSVTSSGNIIKSGTLEVGMYWADGKNNPDDEKTKWTDASEGAIFNYALWEPGYSEVRHIKIENKGSLALKYQVVITANGEVTDLADVIDVYYMDPAKQIEKREDLAYENPMGTLTQALKGMPTTAGGELIAGDDDTVTIALKMQDSAGNKYQNKSIGSSFSIQVIATQLASEEDGFGDNQYDKDAEYDYWNGEDVDTDLVEKGDVYYVSSAKELAGLAKLVNEGETFTDKTVKLTNDIDLWNAPWTPIGAIEASDCATNPSFNGTFDGNGYTIKNLYISEEYSNKDGVGLFASNAFYHDIVIQNLTVDGATVHGNKWVGVIEGYTYGTVTNCTVKNATVYAEGYRAGAVVGFTQNPTVTDNKAENCTIYVAKKVVDKPYNPVVGTINSADASGNTYLDTNTETNCQILIGASTASALSIALTNGNENVVLTGDVEKVGGIVIPTNENVTLNLNGYTVSGIGAAAYEYMFNVSNDAKLTIEDNVGSGKITYAGNNSTGAIVHLEGTLVMKSGTLELTGSWGTGYAVDVRPNEWGTPYANKNTEFTMNGGNIISSGSAVRVASSSIDDPTRSVFFTMNGGYIDAVKDGVFVQQWDSKWDMLNVTVNGGTIESDRNPIRIYGPNPTNADSDNQKFITVDVYDTATLTYTGTDEFTNPIIDGMIRYGGGVTLEEVEKHTTFNINGKTSNIVSVATAETLQKALDEATGSVVINFTADITGNVVATQKDGVNVLINGGGHKYTGVMTVFGDGRQDEAETLAIKNVNFVAAKDADSCIVSPGETVYNKHSYAHNVTIEGCTFTDPDGVVNCAAIRQKDGGDKNWAIKDCTVDSTMHSLAQISNTNGKLTIEGCKVYSKNGVNLNYCTKVEITDCKFDVKGYAVRFGVDGDGGNPTEAKTFAIKNSTLKSACNDGDAVIIFRTTAANAELTLTNTTLVGTLGFSGNTDATTITRN